MYDAVRPVVGFQPEVIANARDPDLLIPPDHGLHHIVRDRSVAISHSYHQQVAMVCHVSSLLQGG